MCPIFTLSPSFALSLKLKTPYDCPSKLVGTKRDTIDVEFKLIFCNDSEISYDVWIEQYYILTIL